MASGITIHKPESSEYNEITAASRDIDFGTHREATDLITMMKTADRIGVATNGAITWFNDTDRTELSTTILTSAKINVTAVLEVAQKFLRVEHSSGSGGYDSSAGVERHGNGHHRSHYKLGHSGRRRSAVESDFGYPSRTTRMGSVPQSRTLRMKGASDKKTAHAEATIAHLEEQVDILNSRIALQRSFHELSNRTRGSKIEGSVSAITKKLRNQFEANVAEVKADVAGEIINLKEQIVDLSRGKKETRDAEVELAKATAELKHATSNIQSLNQTVQGAEKAAAAMSTQVDRLSVKLEAAEQELASSKHSFAIAEEHVSAMAAGLRKAHKAHAAEKATFAERFSQAEAETADLGARIEPMSREIDELTARAETAEATIESLQQSYGFLALDTAGAWFGAVSRFGGSYKAAAATDGEGVVKTLASQAKRIAELEVENAALKEAAAKAADE